MCINPLILLLEIDVNLTHQYDIISSLSEFDNFAVSVNKRL